MAVELTKKPTAVLFPAKMSISYKSYIPCLIKMQYRRKGVRLFSHAQNGALKANDLAENS